MTSLKPHSGSSTNRQRRRSFRVTTPGLKAVCSFRDEPGSYLVTDISLGGAQLAAGSTVPAGSPAYVAILADGRRVLRTNARVAYRDTEAGTMGIAFEGLTESDQQAIDELVKENFLIRRFMGATFI